MGDDGGRYHRVMPVRGWAAVTIGRARRCPHCGAMVPDRAKFKVLSKSYSPQEVHENYHAMIDDELEELRELLNGALDRLDALDHAGTEPPEGRTDGTHQDS